MKNGLIIDKDGSKFVYLNDKLHCENNPAVIMTTGAMEWWIHGILQGKSWWTKGPYPGFDEWIHAKSVSEEDHAL